MTTLVTRDRKGKGWETLFCVRDSWAQRQGGMEASRERREQLWSCTTGEGRGRDGSGLVLAARVQW